MITSDCAVGVSRRRKRRLIAAGAAALLAAGGGVAALKPTSAPQEPDRHEAILGQARLGVVRPPVAPVVDVEPMPVRPPDAHATMGATTVQPAPLMGKVAPHKKP